MLARYRQKDTLPIVLPFIQNVLVEYLNTAPESRNYKKKDGALVAIAVLAKVVLNYLCFVYVVVCCAAIFL